MALNAVSGIPEAADPITAAELGQSALLIGGIALGLWLGYKGITMTVKGENTFSSNS